MMAGIKSFTSHLVIPLFFLCSSALFQVITSLNNNTLCIEEERMALLNIKKDLKDPASCLSSWVGKDCCNWVGVECHNQTGHVVKLDLGSDRICSNTNWSPLGGELNPSLVDLKHLSYLDLSANNFPGIPIPNFIGSLTMLRYLDLSDAQFSGIVPPQLANLSNLYYLGLSTALSFPYTLSVRDLTWLSHLTSLQYLDMSGINISNIASNGWFPIVNMIPSLVELHFSNCNLDVLQPLPFNINFSSLSVLDLSLNDFNSSIPLWLFNISTLTTLNIEGSSLRGSIPSEVAWRNLCKLQILDLSSNYLNGNIKEIINALSSCSNNSLEKLDLSSNSELSGYLPDSLGQFKYIKELKLSSNSILGPIPLSIRNLSSLETLKLDNNKMNGTIPESIGQLSKLQFLELVQNSWEGTIIDTHFENLTNLLSFSISSTKLGSLAFKVTHDWIPLFNLYYLEISECQFGPTFPSWLRTQKKLEDLVLRNAGISSSIPDWLWNISSQISRLDLSRNKISGYLPKALNFSWDTLVNLASNQLEGSIPSWSGVGAIYLRNNSLSGPIPSDIGILMSNLSDLDLSNNLLNGSIPSTITMLKNLSYLDLSNNFLIGQIPNGWMGMEQLSTIDLSNNSLSGEVPTSICSLPSLDFLQLSSNDLSQNLSSAFQNCTWLTTLDLGNNRFFGTVPGEIGKSLVGISELILRGNSIMGNIPRRLCRLPFLHLLDLAENNLSGAIPACLGNVDGFKVQRAPPDFEYVNAYGYVSYTEHAELVVKGRKTEYFNLMESINIIDLSRNNLFGQIPKKLTELLHLNTLNLSWNHFHGSIPMNIGSLRNLEMLDLSHNHLSGPIPSSMVSLTFLSHLNLSYNNLSGPIPLANQFNTFNDPSIYKGNPKLCGAPLLTNCSSSANGDNNQPEDVENEDEDMSEKFGFYVSMGLGYIVGFWAVCGSLVIKRSWRHAYFKFVNDMKDKLIVIIKISLARARRRFGFGRN